jgi:hypothetical protein
VRLPIATVAAVTAGIGLVAGPSCLSDLPEPVECNEPDRIVGGECVRCPAPLVFVGDECRECPPPAVVPETDCPRAFDPPIVHGCLGATDAYARFACVAGDPPDCACAEDACRETVGCFSGGSCPREVTDAEPDAECLILGEDRLGFLGTNAETCTCGCPRCMLICDGRGPSYGVYDDGETLPSFTLQGPTIDLEGLMPPSGRFGFYVRKRGYASVAAFLTSSTTISTQSLQTAYFVEVVSEFTDSVHYGPDEMGGVEDLPQPYAWSSPEDAPKQLTLVLAFGDQDPMVVTPTPGLAEIDCIIPFVVAD